MNFVIEKNIPITSMFQPRAKRESKYPFSSLEIGDSFFVPMEEGDKKVRQNLAAAVHRESKTLFGGKYITRRAEGGIRVWRTA